VLKVTTRNNQLLYRPLSITTELFIPFFQKNFRTPFLQNLDRIHAMVSKMTYFVFDGHVGRSIGTKWEYCRGSHRR